MSKLSFRVLNQKEDSQQLTFSRKDLTFLIFFSKSGICRLLSVCNERYVYFFK